MTQRARIWGGAVVPVFEDFYFAKAEGMFSRSSWKSDGRLVAEDATPDGVVITKSGLASKNGICTEPVFDCDPDSNGFLKVGAKWFYVFKENQTTLIISKSKNKERKKEEGTRGKGSLMTEKCSQVLDKSGLRATLCEAATNSVNNIRTYVPEGLIISDTCTVRHGIWYFLGLIYWQHLEQRLKWEEPVNLKYDYLKANIPDWVKVWDWCQANRVVERIGGYTVGSHSYGYRTCEPYRMQTHRLVTFENRTIANRLRKASRQFYNRPVLTELRKQLARLQVDWELFKQKYASHPDRHYYEAHLRTITDKEFRFTQDDFSGRIHTNVTNLYKPLRGLLRVDDQPGSLCEIDIKNSQPLFLGLAAKKSGFADPDYLALVEQGQLYDHLAQWMGVLRESAKAEFIKMLYARNGFRSTLKGLFERLFPITAAYTFKTKIKDHRRLARQMQEAERKFVIDTICKRVISEIPGCFVTTIHDSVLAMPEDCERIRLIMSDEFRKLGMSPSLEAIRL
jgi:hypothetical protein